uniref:Helicase C-terminal domain-containing protein n=1 Tax=viral metagenome TaxID=1070528 RepID=A0A6C0JVE9_9ZZZZ
MSERRGFKFTGVKIKVEKAPEILRKLNETDMKPGPITSVVRGLLSRPERVERPLVPKSVAPKPSAPKSQAPALAPALAPAPAPSQATGPKKFVVKRPPVKFEDPNLEEMARLIREEEKKNPYENPAGPEVFVPETRRGFSEFIKETYNAFMLEPTEGASPTEAGDKYPYQKFIREYMRQATPYRGILTYHGLGSGKTCTAIATSEALFSTSNKKIIVMTPFSLRKNFLKEVSLCGFRHFRLQNYWEELPISDPTTQLFAKSVLGLTDSYLKTATSVWVPDFRKGADASNYSTLDATQQTEIRRQILSVLVWHEEKNPNGRIRFINYNGISAKKLQAIACKKPANFFDDAVIIVDEIHNLVRLMQGTIDPYLIRMKGLRRLIPNEEVTVDKWNPTLCLQGTKTYARGYLFYRLLLSAQNSKIVGLSGTPLINFPEELGILMNILHGYIPTLEFTIRAVGAVPQQQITDIMLKHPFVDFVRVGNDAAGGGSRVVCSLLPYGIKKIGQDVGVQRIPEGEAIPSINEIIPTIEEDLKTAGFIVNGSITAVAKALLPPFGEEFAKNFISANAIKNKIVLVKRLTGLISYYKGSRTDLMPAVKVDEVVRVPMSVYSQRMYVEARESEISSEKKKKGGEGASMSAVWAEVYEMGTAAKTSNYKMTSRQACNFTFPPAVLRPRPKTRKEQLAEAGAGDVGGDIVDGAPERENFAEEFPELDAAEKEDVAEAAVAAAEEDELAQAIDAAEGGEDAVEEAPPAETVGGGEDDIVKPAPASAAPKPLKTLLQKKASTIAADCKAGQKPGEDYKVSTVRAKECLVTLARDNLRLDKEDGLKVYSPKFAEMLKRISEARGSSLVYSQFLDMEGIGIFRLCMDVNGYAPIEIIKTPTGFAFSKLTEMSFKKGPGVQPRYITFSGGEEEDVRRLALDIFNAKFDELPANIKSILEGSAYINNHLGEICKVFCITSAGAEGLSLKNVRAVHIMEPYWNDVRLRQVKGRAIRIGSHLELPEEERNVSIYTYLTCFSEVAQKAKSSGEDRIDETIRLADRVEKKEAVALGLPIPEGSTEYVVTTDERLYLIAERKKGILNSLESVMKSAAVDCELNIKQNNDGSFKCLPLEGKVGDFMYHPDLDIDIRESASKFKESGPAEPAVNVIFKKLNGKPYRFKPVAGGFEIYGETDSKLTKLLGKTGEKGGQPAAPVTWAPF